MKSTDFEEFLKAKKQAQRAADAIDWESEKREWLNYLKKLYEAFQAALDKYRKKGEIAFEFPDIDISEEHIGTYKAPMMVIILASETISLRPMGTNVIAAKGKVVMEGIRSEVTLVLVDSDLKRPGDAISVTITVPGESPRKKKVQPAKKVKWEWKFVIGPPYREFLPVTEETVLEMLMKVSGGE
jgi:hypothetical protein